MKGRIIICLLLFFSFVLCQDELKGAGSFKGDYDDEEFVGFEHVEEKVGSIPEKKDTATVTMKAPEQPNLPPPRTNNYLEIFYGGIIAIYLVNFYLGMTKNQQLAESWSKAVKERLETQFTSVGEKDVVGILTKEYQHSYYVKATGRQNTIGLQATVNLRKRQDLFSMLLAFFVPVEDTVTYDVLLPEDSMDNFTFGLTKRKTEKRFRKEFIDLATFKAMSAPVGETSFVAISEFDEVIPQILTGDVIATLTKFEHMVDRIYLTDRSLTNPTYKKHLQFVFRLPSNTQDMANFDILTRMVLHVTDSVAKIRLSKAAALKSVEKRNKVDKKDKKAEHEARQEAAQARKAEKLQKEREYISSLDPQRRRAYEEKEERRKAKKAGPRLKVTKV
eukprot:TRINITY_DN19294_c0_g1_i1.p1 TRINITY_DN19294_c0_g1~~TRINITY_DN19294_c0_g1_i1.p1  ORF type:complete len:390 (+),score=85.67 TRINITY_DN19294_c0_g1_i1:3236-4405(+)